MSQAARLVIVDEIAGLSNVLHRPNRTEWQLELAELTRRENRSFEREIKKYDAACGCPHGAAAMFLSVIGYVAFLFLGDVHRPDRIIAEVVAGSGLIILSVGLGKLFGLSLARRGLRRSLQQLRRQCEAARGRTEVNRVAADSQQHS